MKLVITDSPPATSSGKKIAIAPIQETKPLAAAEVAIIARPLI